MKKRASRKPKTAAPSDDSAAEAVTKPPVAAENAVDPAAMTKAAHAAFEAASRMSAIAALEIAERNAAESKESPNEEKDESPARESRMNASPPSLNPPPRMTRHRLIAAKTVLETVPVKNRDRRETSIRRDKELLKRRKEEVERRKVLLKKVKGQFSTKASSKSSPKTPAASAKKTQAKTPASTGGRKESAKEIWSGPPDDDFEYSWKGWTKKKFLRASGKTKGTSDSYWYTPVQNYKLRSLAEVRRFHGAMKTCRNNEEKAWLLFKGKTK